MVIPIYMISLRLLFMGPARQGVASSLTCNMAGAAAARHEKTTVPAVNPLLREGPYGIKRAHFKQSNPRFYRHARLGAALEPYL